tara:strand:+ start:4189 stop:4593 length:405 start_codon:yes stop_codon:yes gene_type:complete
MLPSISIDNDKETKLTDSDNVKGDYDYSRKTYYELIEKGKESLELAMRIAEETEHPRAIEVLAGMLKNVSDVNDRLMELNRKLKNIKREDPKSINNHTTNNVMIASTADLQKLLKQDAKESIIDVTPTKLSRES